MVRLEQSRLRVRSSVIVVVLAAAALATAGCGTLLPLIPAPESVGFFEPRFADTIPDDDPAAEPRLAGRDESERTAMSVYHGTYRSVVNITALSVFRNRVGLRVPSTGAGSGFFLDDDGHLATNNHVIRGAQSLVVTLHDGSNYRGTVVGTDEELDIAVLKIDGAGRRFEPVRWAQSDTLQIGQTVYALGNPFGLEGTLTAGLVSGLRRPWQSESGFIINNLIQTDAAINPGNSGGPLLDTDGRVVGMNVMIVSPSGGSVGIGFALPADTVVRTTEQLIAEGRVVRGWIELVGVAVDRTLARAAGLPVERGLLVTRVVPGGNAARAELRDGEGGRTVHLGYPIPVEGDVILEVGGQRVTSLASYFGALTATRPGDVVTLRLLRDGREFETTLELVARPATRG